MLACREAHDLASRLIRETITRQRGQKNKLTLHSDRGPSMRSHDVSQLLATLGVTKSHSRPHVSNDNPFSEIQFKTLKYQPEFPDRFESLESALGFCRRFFEWYNEEHYHTGIGLLTPSSLHRGRATSVLGDRHRVLEAAYDRHPERFLRGRPKPKTIPKAVWINPPTNRLDDVTQALDPMPPASTSTHHQLGYPAARCVPAGLASVSPIDGKVSELPASQQAFEHRSDAGKIRGLGGWPPREKTTKS